MQQYTNEDRFLPAPATTAATAPTAATSTGTTTASSSADATATACGTASTGAPRITTSTDALEGTCSPTSLTSYPSTTTRAASTSQPLTPTVTYPTTSVSQTLAATIPKTALFSQITSVAGTALTRQFLTAALCPATKIFTRLDCLGITAPVELLSSRVVSVTDALSMAGVMLEGAPFSLPARLDILLGLLAINVCIKIGVSVDIDIDITAAPVGAPPGVSPRSAERDTCPKGKHGCAKRIPGRIPWVRRVSRIRPCPINYRRIIGRDIDDLRIRRLDFDDFLLDDYFLLLRGLQITGGLSLGAQPLNRIQDLLLILKKCIPQFLGPIELIAHFGKHFGEVHERPHAGVPVLFLQRLG